MEEEQQDNFRFRISGQAPDNGYADDLQDLRLEKLSQRVTLISIVIPCLIVVLLVIAYFDIKKRMDVTQDTETRNVERISSRLENQIGDIQAQISGWDEKFTGETGRVRKALADLEKQQRSMATRLDKMEKSIQAINADKADKKDQDRYLAQLKTSLEPVGAEIQRLQASLAENNKNYTQKLQALTEVVQGVVSDTDATVKRVEDLSRRMVGRDALDLELLKAKKAYQLEIGNLLKTVQADLAGVHRELEKLKSDQAARPAPSAPNPTVKPPVDLPSLDTGGQAPPAGENLPEQDSP